MDTSRTLRIARFFREAVQYDPKTREPYRFHERNKPLLKYKGRQDVFGSFTEVLSQGQKRKHLETPENYSPKLGINPSTIWSETPLGLYAYPVDYLIGLYDNATESFGVPFAGGSPYLHLFQVSNPTQNCMVFEKGQTQIRDRYMQTLGKQPLTDEGQKILEQVRGVTREIAEILKDEGEMGDIPRQYRQFWTQMDGATQANFSDWYRDIWYPRMASNSGLDQISSWKVENLIVLYGNLVPERLYYAWTIGDEFDPDLIINVVRDELPAQVPPEVLFPFEKQIRKLPPIQSMSQEEYSEFKKFVVRDDIKCDQAFAWKIAQSLSHQNIKTWTGLLRKLGFIGAVDHGTGTIYEDEPTQAVFFDPGSIKSLEVIHNKSSLPEYPSLKREKSKWSRDPDAGSDEAITKFSNFMYMLEGRVQSGQGYYGDNQLREMVGVIGWLNQHAGDHPSWKTSERERWAQLLKTLRPGIMRNQRDSSPIFALLNKMITFLRRPRSM